MTEAEEYAAYARDTYENYLTLVLNADMSEDERAHVIARLERMRKQLDRLKR